MLSSTRTLDILNPARSRALRATSCDLPVTSGILVDCGPTENHTLTLDPEETLAPPLGSCFVKVPSG